MFNLNERERVVVDKTTGIKEDEEAGRSYLLSCSLGRGNIRNFE